MVVFIVLCKAGDDVLVESVWSTRELASAAILFHAKNDSRRNLTDYFIVTREVNTAQVHRK